MTNSRQVTDWAVGTMARLSGRRLSEYLHHRDSGVRWLRKIPSHWNIKRLKYCVHLINAKVDGRESDLPYTGLEHIESWTGKRIPSDGSATSEGQSSLFRPGDVLFGKLRPYLAKVLRAHEEGICTGELLVLEPRSVTQAFLFYHMVSIYIPHINFGRTFSGLPSE